MAVSASPNKQSDQMMKIIQYVAQPIFRQKYNVTFTR
jgi:hypothetical protein